MKVELTQEAQSQARRTNHWWRQHRDKHPSLFRKEMRAALEKLARHPGVYRVYDVIHGVEVRRIVLPGTRHYLYYLFEEASVVRVVAVWGAPKSGEPDLEDVLR